MSDDIVHPLRRCTKCGVEKPATTEYFRKEKRTKVGLCSWCKACERQYQTDNAERISANQKRWREENKEYLQEYNREYNANNKERQADTKRRYYLAHRETILGYHRRYYTEHRDTFIERSRQWRIDNPDANREYLKTYYPANRERVISRVMKHHAQHPEFARARNARRKARKKQLPSTFTEQQWANCLEYFHLTCAYCGAQQDFWNVLEMEHFILLASPDCTGTTAHNIVPSCKGCNNSKSDKPAREWLTQRYGKRKAKQILARIQAYFDSLK